MFSQRRIIVFVVLLASLTGAAGLGTIAWRAHQALKRSAAAVAAQDSFRVSVATIQPANPGMFHWFAAPAVFTGGAVYGNHLYLCGPSGLYVYSTSGKLVKIYRVGRDLPAAPLTAMAVGTPSNARRPELLIATHGAGILSWNGSHFRQIAALSSSNPGKLDAAANTVTALLPLASGRLLIGTAKRGLLVYDGRRIRYFQHSLRKAYITALAGTGSSLWIGTQDHGLIHEQGGTTVHLGMAQGLPDPHIGAIAVSDGTAFAATPVGVAAITQDQVQRVLAQGIFAQALFVQDPTGDPSLAVGSLQQGIFDIALGRPGHRLRNRIHAGSALQASSPGTSSAPIQQFFESGNQLYAVARNGLYRSADAGTWRKVVTPAPSMLSARNISALAVDPTGRLWVGYFDRGLDIVSPGHRHSRYIEDDHIFCVNRIVRDPARDTVDVGTANGLVFFDASGHERQVMERHAGLISPDVTDVALYRNGMALATPAGITFVDDTGAHSIYAFQGLVNNHVYALGIHHGELLAGTLGGISVLHNDSVTLNLTSSTSGLRHNWITAIVPDHHGWFIGTYGEGVQHLSAANRFSITSATQSGVDINPNAMLATPGLVLAGTLNHGLFVLNRKTGRWRTIVRGLPSRNVTAFAVSDGTIYIGTDNGLISTTEKRLGQ